MNDLEKEVEKLIAQKTKEQNENKKKISENNKKNTKNQSNDLRVEKNNDLNYISKKEIIKNLYLAKKGHQNWMSNVQILTRTGNIHNAKTSIPFNFTACDFGKWYFGKGQMLVFFKEYQNLDRPHQMIHDTYLQIFDLYKKRIEGSLFNSEVKQKKARKVKLDVLVKILLDYSTILFDNLFLLESTIKNLSEQQMDELNMV